MNKSFVWQCPNCEGANFESCVDEDYSYKCVECNSESMLTFSVELVDVALVNDSTE